MLTIQAALGAFLFNASSLAALVPADEGGGRAIYANRGRQDSRVSPYVVWKFPPDGYREVPEVGGPPAIADCRVEVHCYATDYDAANAVAAAVQDLFHFMSPTTGGIPGGPQVLWSGILDTRDEEVIETGMFEVTVEVGLQVDLEIAA